MDRLFIYTEPFQRAWKAMGLGDDGLENLEDILLEDPHAGDVISGLHGARKMRIQLAGRGKSGGGRVIYLDIFSAAHTYLLFAYPKNVQENLTPRQEEWVGQSVLEIKRREGESK